MRRSSVGYLVLAGFLVTLAGCYGISKSTQCKVCEDSKEGHAEGAEWGAEYIHDKFQCKIEGGKVMTQHREEWKECS